jgi:uncharacterized membrane protein YkoI
MSVWYIYYSDGHNSNNSKTCPPKRNNKRSTNTMKIKRFFALAAIAILAVGVMGFVSTRVHAQSGTQPVPQVQVTEVPDNEEVIGADTDQVEEQVGDQNGPDTADESEIETSDASSKDGQDAAPSGTPAITSDAALIAAQTYLNSSATGTVTLDDENGKLVYSVDLNGSDVKIDAMTGVVLGLDQVGDDQSESGN